MTNEYVNLFWQLKINSTQKIRDNEDSSGVWTNRNGQTSGRPVLELNVCIVEVEVLVHLAIEVHPQHWGMMRKGIYQTEILT